MPATSTGLELFCLWVAVFIGVHRCQVVTRGVVIAIVIFTIVFGHRSLPLCTVRSPTGWQHHVLHNDATRVLTNSPLRT